MGRFTSFMPTTLLRKPRKTKPPSEASYEDDRPSDGDDDRREPAPVARKPSRRRGPKLGINELQEELDARESHIRALMEEKNEMIQRLEDMEQNMHALQQECDHRTEQLHSEVDRHEQTRQLLKGGKGGGGEALGPVSDTLTKADVIGLIEGLNTEVMQMASHVAEAFKFDKADDGKKPSDEVREARAEASRILGRKFIDMLRSPEHQGDPTLVQLALQASIHSCCRRIVSSRHFDRSRYGALLTDICRGISEAESQAVAGRWRALTRSHFQRVLAEWKRKPEEDFVPDVMNIIEDVLVVAGVAMTRSKMHDTMKTQFRDRLASIQQKTIRLNKAVVEEITSADIDVLYHHPRAEFDPATMDDANAVTRDDSEVASGEEILCTIDLGLRQYVKLPANKGEAEWAKTILLKAKVVLPDRMKEMRESRQRERRSVAEPGLLHVAVEHQREDEVDDTPTEAS